MMTDQELEKGLVPLKIIWYAMLVSLLVYLFVGLQVGADMRIEMADDTLAVIRPALYGAAFLTPILIRYIRKYLLAPKGPSIIQNRTSQHPILQRYTIAMVVTWALSESIGIYGFILFLLGKNTVDLYMLVLVSALVILLHSPKKEEIVDLLEEDRKHRH